MSLWFHVHYDIVLSYIMRLHEEQVTRFRLEHEPWTTAVWQSNTPIQHEDLYLDALRVRQSKQPIPLWLAVEATTAHRAVAVHPAVSLLRIWQCMFSPVSIVHCNRFSNAVQAMNSVFQLNHTLKVGPGRKMRYLC